MAKKNSVTATDGRVIGARASQTRQRLLDATERLLVERGVLNLTVVDITRTVETSPATFYQYFTDVSEAIKALSEQTGEDLKEIVPLFEVPWDGADGHERAIEAAEAFIAYWQRHQAVLRIRGLRADEGDVEFRRLRRHSLIDLMNPITEQLQAGQKAGLVSEHLNPVAAASAIYAMLEKLAPWAEEFKDLGVSRDEVVDTIATVMRQTMTGKP